MQPRNILWSDKPLKSQQSIFRSMVIRVTGSLEGILTTQHSYFILYICIVGVLLQLGTERNYTYMFNIIETISYYTGIHYQGFHFFIPYFT